jgi:succinoglycan biosynthesis transport protein ExoP
MNERTLHPLDYLLVLKRRKWWFVVPLVVCLVVGLALALFLPATYRSAAVIAVQAPNVTPDLVAGRAVLDTEERLRALSQQLRSPAVLERVVREENLAAGKPIEEVMQEMVGRIDVEIPKPIARTEGGPPLNAFEIVYRDGTASGARRVANRLAHVFVDEHSRSREVQAEGTSEFIAAQLRASQEKINQLESKLRTLKEQHQGRLPEQTPANLQTLAGMRHTLESTQNALVSEQDRLTMLERQMQQVRQGLYSAPGISGLGATPQQRVVALTRKLAEARSLYTDKHPEVQLLEEELKAAREEVAAAAKQPEDAREVLLAADPTYQQLRAEQNLIQLRVRALRRAETQLRADIARYQRNVDTTPMVEQELLGISREYDNEREHYKNLQQRHQTALVQEQIARTRGGERFSVLNAAYLPESPESPKRVRLLLIALALGLALGGGAAFGRDYLDPSIRDARALQDEFDVPVLAEIPHISRHRAA